jgi:hypothetical protein
VAKYSNVAKDFDVNVVKSLHFDVVMVAKPRFPRRFDVAMVAQSIELN